MEVDRSHTHLYDEDALDKGFRSTRYPVKHDANNGGEDPETRLPADDEEEVEIPQMSVTASVVLLAIVTVVCSFQPSWTSSANVEG